MRLGRKLVSIDEDKDGVNLVFDDGQSERFDLLVGADGLSNPKPNPKPNPNPNPNPKHPITDSTPSPKAPLTMPPTH